MKQNSLPNQVCHCRKHQKQNSRPIPTPGSIEFTSESFKGFRTNITTNQLVQLTDRFRDEDINIRGLIVSPMYKNRIACVLVPGVVGESNYEMYKQAKVILKQMCISWKRTYWVVVDTTSTPGQFGLVYQKLERLAGESVFSIDESTQLAIATDDPYRVMKKLMECRGSVKDKRSSYRCSC